MKYFVAILISWIFISCQTDKGQDIIKEQVPVYTGTVNENMYSEDFGSGYAVSYTWSNCGYGDALDSIDLLHDGIDDLFFEVRLFNPDLFFGNCCPPGWDCDPDSLRFIITMKNGYEVAYYETTIYGEFHSSVAYDFNSNIRIDTISMWSSNVDLWNESNFLFEPWYCMNSIKYIAIRKLIDKNYYYGWFKIEPGPYCNLIFKNFSIESFQ